MERRQQERLVGAVVVVLAAAVLVPWFLDGSPERWRARGSDPGVEPRLRREVLDLGAEASAPTVVAPAPPEIAPVPRRPADAASARAPERRERVAQVGPADGAAGSGAGASADGEVTRAPAVASRPGAGRDSPPRGGDGATASADDERHRDAVDADTDEVIVSGWAVQVGSFRDRRNAQRLAEALAGKGYRAFLSRHTRSGQTFYRVRVGPEQTRAAAGQTAARLRRDGQATDIVRHP